MFDFVARLAQAWNRPAPQSRAARRPRQGFVPRLEALEDRMTPANTVTSTFTSGTLTITGLDSAIVADNHQNITLTGAAGSFTLAANGTEVITGVLDPNNAKNGVVTGVVNVKFVMNRGNDVVNVFVDNLPGTLTFLGGDGDNTLNIDANAGITTIGAISITNGDGTDTFRVRNGANNFKGVTINNGIGDSNTIFGVNATDDTTITGNLVVINGDGFDTFDVNGDEFKVTGGTTIRNSIGGSTTTFDNTTTNLNSTLSIANLAGFDTLSFAGTTANLTSAIITNGNDGSTTTFGSATTNVKGTLSVTSADGEDDFTANGGTFTVDVPGTAVGNVTISTGNGGGQTIIQPTTGASIDGRLTFTSSAGDDQLILDGLTVTGLTNINTGSGNDQIGIDASIFTGSVTINTGAGNDIINIEDNSDGTDDNTIFNGTVTVLAGSGDDLLSTGFDANNRAVFNKAPVKFDGGLGLDTFNRTFYAGVALTTLNTINWETIIPPLP